MKTLNILISTLVLSFLFYSCDKNEFAPEILDQDFVVSENSPSGSTVGTVVATDVDGPTLSYEIVDGNEDRVFTIDASSGKLTIDNNENLDYESTMLYVLQVVVSDNHNKDPLESSADMHIEITDANEYAPKIPNMENQAFSISEDSQIGTQVGIVEATDEDSEQTVTYSIKSGNDSGIFAINSENGVITVADNSTLDYEVTTQYNLIVAASDDHQEDPRESTANLQVNVLDVNEFAPEIEAQTFTLDENPSNGQELGQVVATDNDIHQSLIYNIIEQNDKAYFGMDSLTGMLWVADSSAFDFESTEQFTLQVQVKDNHSNPLKGSTTVTVNLSDVLEITDALMAYYPFNGNANDASGNGMDGQVKGPESTTDRMQNSESALEMDGLDDNIAMADDFDFQEKSVSLFFKPTSIPVFDYENNPYASWSSLIICDHPGLIHSDIKILLSKIDGIDKVWIWKNEMAAELDPNILSAPISTDSWNHIAVTYSSDSIKLYINGQPMGGTKTTENIQSTTGVPYMVVGSGRGEKYRFFDGKVDEMYVHERVLEAWEVSGLYQMK